MKLKISFVLPDVGRMSTWEILEHVTDGHSFTMASVCEEVHVGQNNFAAICGRYGQFGTSRFSLLWALKG